MRYVKIIIAYIVIVPITMQLLARLFTDTWFEPFAGFIGIAIFCGMLCHIGILIYNKELRRKYFAYMGVIVGIFALFAALSAITGIALQDTWLGAIGGGLLFVTIFAMFFDISKVIAKTNDKLGAKLQLIGVMGCIITVIVVPVIIIGLSAG